MNNIKIYKCPNCGANATNSDNCEYCGSMLVRFAARNIDTQKTSYIDNSNTIESFLSSLHLNLFKQKQFEKECIITDVYKKMGNNHECLISVLRSGYCTFQNGNPIPSSKNNGLCIVLGFYPDDPADKANLETFKTLPCFPLFTEHIGNCDYDRDLIVQEYYLDFGEDSEGAARILSEIINKVYKVPKDNIRCYTDTVDVIENKRSELMGTPPAGDNDTMTTVLSWVVAAVIFILYIIFR